MGHDKLRKFAENETFSCLLQPEAGSVLDKSEATDGLRLKNHPIKGHWNEKMFTAAQPIVLELGCGKGEYTIDLSRREPSLNYIGVDIKGAGFGKERSSPRRTIFRMWPSCAPESSSSRPSSLPMRFRKYG